MADPQTRIIPDDLVTTSMWGTRSIDYRKILTDGVSINRQRERLYDTNRVSLRELLTAVIGTNSGPRDADAIRTRFDREADNIRQVFYVMGINFGSDAVRDAFMGHLRTALVAQSVDGTLGFLSRAHVRNIPLPALEAAFQASGITADTPMPAASQPAPVVVPIPSPPPPVLAAQAGPQLPAPLSSSALPVPGITLPPAPFSLPPVPPVIAPAAAQVASQAAQPAAPAAEPAPVVTQVAAPSQQRKPSRNPQKPAPAAPTQPPASPPHLQGSQAVAQRFIRSATAVTDPQQGITTSTGVTMTRELIRDAHTAALRGVNGRLSLGERIAFQQYLVDLGLLAPARRGNVSNINGTFDPETVAAARQLRGGVMVAQQDKHVLAAHRPKGRPPIQTGGIAGPATIEGLRTSHASHTS